MFSLIMETCGHSSCEQQSVVAHCVDCGLLLCRSHHECPECGGSTAWVRVPRRLRVHKEQEMLGRYFREDISNEG
jgi:hypothetical protein